MANLSPGKVLAYKASGKAQKRVNTLLSKNSSTDLTSDENAEMECYMTVEHIVHLAKAKAMQKLNI